MKASILSGSSLKRMNIPVELVSKQNQLEFYVQYFIYSVEIESCASQIKKISVFVVSHSLTAVEPCYLSRYVYEMTELRLILEENICNFADFYMSN
ncbi:hypothetical protein BpHYR1_014437 [Brachionus plicatilis]|uniref:Uncharacterized protein n=1 Tax=Brachionus plicatilis TaxID=10195 RepID=A0A3M7RJY6_BRAPC|nr:hypothetical protein BpHYR1_014437 [Brachionus plicatilis]